MKEPLILTAKAFNILQDEIRLWKDVVSQRAGIIGAADSRLCNEFMYGVRGGPNCIGCPVMSFTRYEMCEVTPYSKFADNASEDGYAVSKTSREGALEYLNILKKIRNKSRIETKTLAEIE